MLVSRVIPQGKYERSLRKDETWDGMKRDGTTVGIIYEMGHDDQLVRALGKDRYSGGIFFSDLLEETNTYIQTFDEGILKEQLYTTSIGVTPLVDDLASLPYNKQYTRLIEETLFKKVKQKIPERAREVTEMLLDTMHKGELIQILFAANTPIVPAGTLDRNIGEALRLLQSTKTEWQAKEDVLLAFSSRLDSMYGNAVSQEKDMKEAVKRTEIVNNWIQANHAGTPEAVTLGRYITNTQKQYHRDARTVRRLIETARNTFTERYGSFLAKVRATRASPSLPWRTKDTLYLGNLYRYSGRSISPGIQVFQ